MHAMVSPWLPGGICSNDPLLGKAAGSLATWVSKHIGLLGASWSGCGSQWIHKMANKRTLEVGVGGGEVAGEEELFWLLNCVGCS